jgi:hypothetical protein
MTRALIMMAMLAGAACIDNDGARRSCRDPLLADGGSPGGADDGGQGGGADEDGDGGEGGDGGGGGARICQRSQPVFVCDVANARDLGGVAVANGQSVACGALYRGAPLAGLSSDGCLAFAARGIRTVIDLRIQSERDMVPEAACVRAAANLVSAPMPVPYDVSAADYIADLDAKTSVAAAFAVLGDPAAYPVYIHCTWGRDRTGVLTALILSALGATRSDIMQEYLISQQTVGAFPSSLIAVLDAIDTRGGVEAVLAGAGVSPEQLATLRAQAIAR